MTFRDYLISLDACNPAVTWVGDRSAAEALDACDRADWYVWLLERLGYTSTCQSAAYYAADRAVRVHTPTALDAAGLPAAAARLRSLRPITDRASAAEAAAAAEAWAEAARAEARAAEARAAEAVAAEAAAAWVVRAAEAVAWAAEARAAEAVAAWVTCGAEHRHLIAHIWSLVAREEVLAELERRMAQ